VVDPEPLSPHSRKLEQPLDGAQRPENHFSHQLDRLGPAALRPGRHYELVTNAWNVKAFIRNFAVVPLCKITTTS
jgi:hypothetical protein